MSSRLYQLLDYFSGSRSICIQSLIDNAEKSIAPEIAEHLKSAGLTVAFNRNSGVEAGEASGLFKQGRYLQIGEKIDGKVITFEIYRKQLRERHAFLYQELMLKAFIEGLEMACPGSMQTHIFDSAHECLMESYKSINNIQHLMSAENKQQLTHAKNDLESINRDDSSLAEKLIALESANKHLLGIFPMNCELDKSTIEILTLVHLKLSGFSSSLKIINNHLNPAQEPEPPLPVQTSTQFMVPPAAVGACLSVHSKTFSQKSAVF